MAKIMLVEDDNNLRQIYEDRLAAEGYQIVSAPDGEEALALAVKERPDLIIADVMMPKVSGFDMLDILRSTPETKDCKIIMMTALSQAEDKARAEKLGADRYLVKSQVTLEDVAKIAGEILSGEPAGASTPAAAPATPAAPAPSTASIPVSAPPTDLPSATVAPTAPAVTPTPAPAVAPAATPVAPTPAAPAATSTVTSIPVTVQSDDNTDDKPVDNTKVATAAEEAAKLATPAAEEKAAAEKVDEFIASNPTLSNSPEPTAPTGPEPTAPAETPTSAPVPPPEPAPAPTTTPASDTVTVKVEEQPANTAPAPAPAADDPSQKVADAVDGLLRETESTPTPTPQEKPKNGYVADGPKTNNESQSMVHTKRIEPISDGSVPQAPDINELLARESGEVAAAQPPVNSVITPGNAGSINTDPVDDTPQVNVLAENESSQPPATPGTVTPTVTPAPGSDITL